MGIYGIKINEDNVIEGTCMGDVLLEEYIEVTEEEYVKASIYSKFNSETREFSIEKVIEIPTPVKTNAELTKENELLNEAITELTELVSMLMA